MLRLVAPFQSRQLTSRRAKLFYCAANQGKHTLNASRRPADVLINAEARYLVGEIEKLPFPEVPGAVAPADKYKPVVLSNGDPDMLEGHHASRFRARRMLTARRQRAACLAPADQRPANRPSVLKRAFCSLLSVA
jgi:hypothetical protein